MFKKRNLIFLSLLLVVFLFTSCCLLKPPVTEGILKGQVMVPEGLAKAKDLTGQALPDATINIIDPLTGAILATTTTDANGNYQVLVPAGGPYLLQAIKDGIKVQQITPSVEVGIEYDLGTADCSTTAVALIVQAMLEDDSYPDDPADINLANIEADWYFTGVLNSVCDVLGTGVDPAVSALVQQAVEDFLHPPTPTPTPHPTPLSSDATISAGTLAGVALAGDFAGGANIGASSALTVTIPDASKTLAALALTKGNANSVIKYVKSATPADDAAYTETYTAGSTTITVVDADVIWLLVTAEDGTTKLYYKITVTVSAPLSSDATLKISSTVKGQTVASLGTPNATLGSETAGAVTITLTQAADTSNAGSFITLFDKTNAGATVNRVVKYATGGSTTGFETDTVYANEAITTLDFFIVKVTAADTTTILYYKVVVTATPAIGDSYSGGIVAYILVSGETINDENGNLLYSYSDTVQHGLIAAVADSSETIVWSNILETSVGTTGIAIGTGQANTTLIVKQAGCTSGAAHYCDDLIEGGKDDWFLPSKDELNKLYINRDEIGGFAVFTYWSSSEYYSTPAGDAWLQAFPSGGQMGNDKGSGVRVRAVRYF